MLFACSSWASPSLGLIVSCAVLLSTLVDLSSSAATCYYPSGIESHHVPCNPRANVSICCPHRDRCLSSGLCRRSLFDESRGFTLGTCTDRNWKSPICLQHYRTSMDKLAILSIEHSLIIPLQKVDLQTRTLLLATLTVRVLGL